MINGLMAEVKLKRPYMTEEEYWKDILALSWNTLADTFTLNSIAEYYDKKDESVLTDSAEKIILQWFGIK